MLSYKEIISYVYTGWIGVNARNLSVTYAKDRDEMFIQYLPSAQDRIGRRTRWHSTNCISRSVI
jgi:hypothetical protein